MKKINLLKAIVDFLWIFSMPVILIVISFAIIIFFSDLSSLEITLNNITFQEDNLIAKILFVISSLNYILLIAALYYFRKALSYFIRIKIFENDVINAFKKTGNLLCISGTISLLISFFGKIYLTQKATLEFSLNEHIVIICFGLFFMILSEIFKIAKNTKQENDLTI